MLIVKLVLLAGESHEESEQFRFLRTTRLANLKDSVGLLLAKDCEYSHRFVYAALYTSTSLF